MTAEARGRPARRPWRAVDGIVLLDKPTGLSSNHALQRVRRLLAAAKGGHAGTLDPLATGMLPLCFGQATKACGPLLGSRKAYRAEIALGRATDTGDAEGRVIAEAPVPPLDAATVDAVLGRFTGEIEQVPPMHSALKVAGRPLYELARRGEEIPREPRRIVIHRLERMDFGPARLVFDVECSKGTYVRVLGEEIARALGTCGHLASLRRLWVEPFDTADLVTLEALEGWASAGGEDPTGQRWWLPADRAYALLPRVDLDGPEARHLAQGRVLAPPAAGGHSGPIRAYGPDGAFLGIVTPTPVGGLRVQRLFVGAPEA
ncbi:MAG: tRNA pseudouridine(55) synthase TruB [Steroidobacteraceae bacterium]